MAEGYPGGVEAPSLDDEFMDIVQNGFGPDTHGLYPLLPGLIETDRPKVLYGCDGESDETDNDGDDNGPQ